MNLSHPPLLDHPLLERLVSLPAGFHLKNGWVLLVLEMRARKHTGQQVEAET